MGWDQFSDFEQEMYALVAEEAPLAAVHRGGVDQVRGGEPIVHGPWDPAICSAHLLRWFDQGLIELYEVGEEHDRVLSSEVGRERLLAWDHWGEDDELWARTCLVVTDAGIQGLDKAVGLSS